MESTKAKDSMIEGLRNQIEDLVGEIRRLKEEKLRVARNTDNLAHSFTSQTASIEPKDELLQEKTMFAELCKSLEKELESGKRANRALTEKVEILTRKNKELDQQIVKQTQNYSSFEAENQRLASKSLYLEKMNQGLQEKCKTLETEKEKLKQQLQSTEEKLKESYKGYKDVINKCASLEEVAKWGLDLRQEADLRQSLTARMPGTIKAPEVTQVTSEVQK